jgi:hypothetical protein
MAKLVAEYRMRGWRHQEINVKVRLKLAIRPSRNSHGTLRPCRKEYNSYRLSDGAVIRMKTVVTNIIRTEEFTPTGEPVYIVNSQNVLVADVPDEMKKPERVQ